MGKTQRYMAMALLALAANTAQATDAPMLVADAGAAVQPRFISLASARQGAAGVRVVAPAMRSDRAAMNAGFMRLDRARIQRVQIRRPASPAVSMAAPRTPRVVASRGNTQDSAVLDLFGDSGNESVQPDRGSRISHAWPLPGNATQKFTSAFGPRKDPFHGRDSFHGGIDIACATGTNVLASAAGIVTKVENGSRYGKYITIAHRDGSESSYGHLSAQSVRVGQRVAQGQKLGEVGATGRATGPHLDYRIKKNGELFNPMTVLRQPSSTTTRVASNTRGISVNNGVKIIR